VFLLAVAAVYLGSIESRSGALMRLSLRLVAERTNRPGTLAPTLDDRCCSSSRRALLLGLVTGAATALLARGIGVAARGPSGAPAFPRGVRADLRAGAPARHRGRDPSACSMCSCPTFQRWRAR